MPGRWSACLHDACLCCKWHTQFIHLGLYAQVAAELAQAGDFDTVNKEQRMCSRKIADLDSTKVCVNGYGASAAAAAAAHCPWLQKCTIC